MYILIICVFVAVSTLYADTVLMKDKARVKGLVVDEYSDRITLNTVDGERTIFRKDIDKIEYDTPEQNFMQLGKAYELKEWYDKAAFYYKKAMELNPDYKEARESYLACHAKIWRQEERMTKKELERRSMVMEWRRDRNVKEKPMPKDKMELLRNTLGMSLSEQDGIFTIVDIRPYYSADKAGIREGDTLAGIWGKLIRYRDTKDVIEELLGPKYSEVRVLIERDVVIPIETPSGNLYKDLGITLAFEYEGLMIKDAAADKPGSLYGLAKGDYVLAVDNNVARYLPFDSIISIINSSGNNKDVVFSIRRSVNLRREGGL